MIACFLARIELSEIASDLVTISNLWLINFMSLLEKHLSKDEAFYAYPQRVNRDQDVLRWCLKWTVTPGSVRWKHSPLHALIDHLRNREERWRESNHSRILKGSISELIKYKVRQRTARVRLEVYIIQPGLSKGEVTDQMLRLLGTTELYRQWTTNAPLFVIGSD